MDSKHVMRSMAGLIATVSIGVGLPASAQQPAGGQRAGGPPTPPLIMTSTAWQDGGVIPDKFTQATGPQAVSPALSWSQVPPGTQSFVLLLHDPEPVLNKGSKMDITHWLVWNIPGTSTGLPEGVATGELPDGTRQVSLRANAYMGPGAPAGPYHPRCPAVTNTSRSAAGGRSREPQAAMHPGLWSLDGPPSSPRSVAAIRSRTSSNCDQGTIDLQRSW